MVAGHQPLIGDAVVGGGSGLVLEVQKLPDARPVAIGALAVGLPLLAATLVLQALGYSFNALVILVCWSP